MREVGARNSKVKEVEHPSLEEGVAAAGDDFNEGCAEDWNRCRMSLQRLTQSSK